MNVEERAAFWPARYVQCEQIRTISSNRLIRRLGAVDPPGLLRIDMVLRRILAL